MQKYNMHIRRLLILTKLIKHDDDDLNSILFTVLEQFDVC